MPAPRDMTPGTQLRDLGHSPACEHLLGKIRRRAIVRAQKMKSRKADAARRARSTDRAALLAQLMENNGGDDGTRTRDLCRDRLGMHVLSATYILAGAAKSLKGTVGTVRCG